MDDEIEVRSADRLTDLLTSDGENTVREYLDHLETAGTGTRKTAMRALRRLAAERPRLLAPVLDALTPFLTDEERSVRLTTAKVFVAVAEAAPDVAVASVDQLADRLGDEDEFYYVRARSAEALGYVALEHPGTVASPELVADLRIGLSFDEPEVKEKLAKALEYVALGDPDRLRHQVPNLAEHLDDDHEFVRYHLSTAVVAIGCPYPERLTDVTDTLAARLSDDDENPYIRGRAAEALGLIARAEPDAVSSDGFPGTEDVEESFAVERLRFARGALAGEESTEAIPDDVGTVEAVRETTEDVVAELTAPDGECPHCGLTLPENGPPTCPHCGAPY